jgi:hypothetical protein
LHGEVAAERRPALAHPGVFEHDHCQHEIGSGFDATSTAGDVLQGIDLSGSSRASDADPQLCLNVQRGARALARCRSGACLIGRAANSFWPRLLPNGLCADVRQG